MDDIRVLINDIEVGLFTANEMGLSTTWSTKLIDEINSFSTATIKTSKLPLTNTVLKALKNPDSLDSIDNASQKKLDKIDFISPSATLHAWLKPQRTVIEQNQRYLQFTIKPRERDWIDLFKTNKLTDIDLSDQNHELNATNIRASELYYPSRMYAYAPIDIGEVTRLQVIFVEQSGGFTYLYYLGKRAAVSTTFKATSYGFNNTDFNMIEETFTDIPNFYWNGVSVYIARSNTPPLGKFYGDYGYLYIKNYSWQCSDFYPAIRFEDLLTRAYKKFGYKVEIHDTAAWDFDTKYHFWHNPDEVGKKEEKRSKFKVRVMDGGIEYTDLQVAPIYLQIPFIKQDTYGLVTNTKYTDTNSNNPTNIAARTNTSKYVATENEIIRFVWEYDIVQVGSAGAAIMFITLYDSTNTFIKTIAEDTSNIGGTNVRFAGRIQTSYVYMKTGDYVVCEFATSVINSKYLIKDTNTFESFPFTGGNFKGKLIRLTDFLPDETIYDWLKDLAFINNLQFYTDELLKKVYIVPDDLKRTGKKITHYKINRDKNVEIDEIGALHPKKYIFNWKQDETDYAVKEVENALGSRFANGELENNNQFTIEEKEISLGIYAASLDKFVAKNDIYFNTLEMNGEEYLKFIPIYPRINYLPRYIDIQLGATLSSHALMKNGEISSQTYSIEGDSTLTVYPYASFQTPLHFSSLLNTRYKDTVRRILFGYILRAYFFITDKDVDGFSNIKDDQNDFRADFLIQLDNIETQTELLRCIDFSNSKPSETKLEMIFYRDNYD